MVLCAISFMYLTTNFIFINGVRGFGNVLIRKEEKKKKKKNIYIYIYIYIYI